MNNDQYVIGVDYGTDSVRSVIIDAANGDMIASSVFDYPRWKKGLFCNPSQNQFSQHPLDFIEGFEFTVKECLNIAGEAAAFNIKAISIDTTGSTPVAVDRSGTPLALLPGFEENPNAMFILWKDHAAVKEADELNDYAGNYKTDYLKYCGGIYSSEWFWAKLLHVLRNDKQITKTIYSWVEHSDWMPFLLTGGNNADKMIRNRCAAGHKALWSEEFGGYPPDDFFSGLDPLLRGFASRLPKDTVTADKCAGSICVSWAKRLGLPANVKIGVGAIDAHMGAAGCQIKPYYLSKVMGTSTCDMMIIPENDMQGKLVAGICGQVNGSIIPGFIGLEAGQSAFGDVYAWLKNLLIWPLEMLFDNPQISPSAEYLTFKTYIEDNILAELNRQAALLPVGEGSEIAVDWLNGRRTPDADQGLKGAIAGLDLATNAPRIFKALAEATCFGAKSIIDRFEREGILVEGIIGTGGVAKKSPYIMQLMANVLGMPIQVHKFEHTCALGCAMFAAVIAGIYPDLDKAMIAMGQGFEYTFMPDKKLQLLYNERYQQYKKLGNFIDASTN